MLVFIPLPSLRTDLLTRTARGHAFSAYVELSWKRQWFSFLKHYPGMWKTVVLTQIVSGNVLFSFPEYFWSYNLKIFTHLPKISVPVLQLVCTHSNFNTLEGGITGFSECRSPASDVGNEARISRTHQNAQSGAHICLVLTWKIPDGNLAAVRCVKQVI